MRKIFKIIIIFLTVTSATGCKFQKEPNFYCPSTNETIYWSYEINNRGEKVNSEVFYGDVELGNFGDEDWGLRLHDECGWGIYQKRIVGVGDILQLSSYYEEVMFIWRWEELNDIHLSEDWRGSTYKGIKMGDSYHKFINAHSDFEFVGTNHNGYDVYALYSLSDDKKYYPIVEAYFMNGRLMEIGLWK